MSLQNQIKMENTITIQETPFPKKEEITIGAINICLGITAIIIIIVLLKKVMSWQDKYVEFYNTSVGDITGLQRKLKTQKKDYENKIYKLEEVIHNLEKNKSDGIT